MDFLVPPFPSDISFSFLPLLGKEDFLKTWRFQDIPSTHIEDTIYIDCRRHTTIEQTKQVTLLPKITSRCLLLQVPVRAVILNTYFNLKNYKKPINPIPSPQSTIIFDGPLPPWLDKTAGPLAAASAKKNRWLSPRCAHTRICISSS